jgi:hypothetical protein
MLMAHRVTLDDSFQNIGDLEQRVQDEIGAIVKGLESNALFEPDPNDYLFERDSEKGECACWRVSWGDWQVTWFYEYSPPSPYFERSIEGVVVMLVRQPLQLRAIQPRKKKSLP